LYLHLLLNQNLDLSKENLLNRSLTKETRIHSLDYLISKYVAVFAHLATENVATIPANVAPLAVLVVRPSAVKKVISVTLLGQ
jgi:hypothetical protein